MLNRKFLRVAGITSIVLLISLIIYHRSLISYGFDQAQGQLTIILNTRPVEEIVLDPEVGDSIKRKIQIVNEARTYAVRQLGLKETSNYTTFYDQQGQVSLWNLSASQRFALEPKLWSFPILGSFPYKGFFDLEKAKEELINLEKEGYDARIRPVGGWSTLGWTKDPILSSMLDRPEGPLVELIIHELTHTTLFVEDNVDFNENLASFIGEQGARQFLIAKYGDKSPQLFEYIFGEEDAITFREHMLRGTKKLDSLYGTLEESLSDSVKSQLKQNMISRICRTIDTLHFHNSRYYDAFDTQLPNNAYFMSYVRYYSAKDSLNGILQNQYDRDLPAFIKGMIEYHQ